MEKFALLGNGKFTSPCQSQHYPNVYIYFAIDTLNDNRALAHELAGLKTNNPIHGLAYTFVTIPNNI